MRSSTGSERTSSQISIYNYPDHLNPFAEEDNHKRLRFWNLSKRNDNRRRSFSMGSLREIWNFKSFSTKKKSSTLGIQKTSESPPVLRRSLEPNSLHPGDQAYGNRRAYTNSLQNVNTPRGIRSSEHNFRVVNSPQRSTISEGYLTPLSQRFHPNRSSQSSLNSTNPFETDIDSDATDIGSVSLGRRSYRKKRRAPLAPTREMLNKTAPSPVRETAMDTQSEVEQNKAIRSLAVEIEQFVNNSNESSTVKVPTVIVEPASVPQSPQPESQIPEQTHFAKVSTNTIQDETHPTVPCTSKSDPVPETVQLDKLNSKIVVSSIVIDEGQQTTPKISDHKASPVVTPRRSHAAKVERVKETKITNTEQETTKTKIVHKTSEQIAAPKTETKLTNIEQDSTTDSKKIDNAVQIVETQNISRSGQAVHRTPEQIGSPKTEPKINKLTNIEDSTKIGNVQIVETKIVSRSPQTVHRTPEQMGSFKTEPKETKLTNIEQDVKTDSKQRANEVQLVETKIVSRSPQTVHKTPEQIGSPKTEPKFNKLPNIERMETFDQLSKTKNTHVNNVRIVETSFVSETPQTSDRSSSDYAKETNVRSLEYMSTFKPVAKTVDIPVIPVSPPTEQRITEQISVSKAPEETKIRNVEYTTVSQTVKKEKIPIKPKTPEQPSFSTPTQLPEETKIRNIAHSSTCEAVHIDRLNGNGSANLQPINESRNLNNFATVQKSYFIANNNARQQHDEYLNKPLAIFENSERKSEHSEDGTQPAKAKSVKEIIDSINRSQKLLKDSAAKGTTVYSTSLYTENNNIRPISNQRGSQLPEISPNISTESSDVQLEQNYFQKSKINKTSFQFRESSPTALNLDWNPLPKPKRINNGSTM